MRFRPRLIEMMVAQGLIDFAKRLRAITLGLPLPEEDKSLAADAAKGLGILVAAFAKYLHFQSPIGPANPDPQTKQ